MLISAALSLRRHEEGAGCEFAYVAAAVESERLGFSVNRSVSPSDPVCVPGEPVPVTQGPAQNCYLRSRLHNETPARVHEALPRLHEASPRVHEARPGVHEASPRVHEATHEVHEAPSTDPEVDFTQLGAPAADSACGQPSS